MSRPDLDELCKEMRDYTAPLAWPADERRAAEQVTEEWFYRLAALIDRPAGEGRMSTDRLDDSFAAEVIQAFLKVGVCPYGYDREEIAALVRRLGTQSGDPGVAVAPPPALSAPAVDDAALDAAIHPAPPSAHGLNPSVPNGGDSGRADYSAEDIARLRFEFEHWLTYHNVSDDVLKLLLPWKSALRAVAPPSQEKEPEHESRLDRTSVGSDSSSGDRVALDAQSEAAIRAIWSYEQNVLGLTGGGRDNEVDPLVALLLQCQTALRDLRRAYHRASLRAVAPPQEPT
jgi:hypothetical protein